MVYNLLLEYGSAGILADVIDELGGCGLMESNVRDMVWGIYRIHCKSYVHCELQPDNMMMVGDCGSGDFKEKIGDLGLAKRGIGSLF